MLIQFTIQNVPIKLEPLLVPVAGLFNLQYKMFLLNVNNDSFNSRIKNNLQYKMFLLNKYG